MIENQVSPTAASPKTTQGWLWQILGVGILLLIWHVLTAVLKIWPPYVMPTPFMVWQEFQFGFFGQDPDGQLGQSILGSLRRVLIGYGIAVVLGTLTGLLLSAWQPLRETVGGWLTAIQSVPSIAFVPLAILWFGLNEKAVLFVVILEGFIPIALAVSSAILNVPPALRIAGRTLGAHGFTLYTKVLLPASLPYLATGLRTAWSFAWRALVGGELLTSNPGVGQILEIGRNTSNMALVLTAILIVGVIGSLFDTLMRKMEMRIRYNYGLEVQS